MAELPQLQRLLLGLIAPGPVIPSSAVTALTTADWEWILRMVRQHRLGPLLHWQLTRTRPELPIPETVRDVLAARFKRSTRRALVARRELVLIHRLLTAAGIPYQALKGAFLAFHAYPQPGLRPLRDLDILVPKAEALRAFEVLIAGGLVRPPEHRGTPEAQLSIHHQLPPLRTAAGEITVEIHARLQHPVEGAAEAAAQGDPSDDPDYWRRGITTQAGQANLCFPAPTDLLLHLIVHAVGHHKFDNGPLILSDIAWLLSAEPIDWPDFWRRAEHGGDQRACWLTLQLVERYWGTQPIDWPAMASDPAAAESAGDTIAALMLQDVGQLPVVNLTHALGQQSTRRGKLGLLLRRLIPSKVWVASAYPVRPDSPRVYLYYLPHLWRLASQRLPLLLMSRRNQPAQDALRQLAQFERWLVGADVPGKPGNGRDDASERARSDRGASGVGDSSRRA